MRPKALNLIVALILSTFGAATVDAQQNQPARPQPAQSQPTAQSSAAQGGSDASGSAAAPSMPAKKVWTNEDLSGLRDRSAISTFDSKNAIHAGGPAKTSSPARGRDANWYRQQIAKLQGQIPPLDRKIAELHTAIEGNSTNDPNTSSRPYRGVKPGSWQSEMEQMETKRANILARIDALEDQARHAGVAANALP
ncbi:MAG: hypothetical protein ACRD4S_13490 [Candidatus Acidiferrales bacterium]